MKTKRNTSKRFITRPSGTIKHGQAFKHHILVKKITENKHHLRGTEGVHETNLKFAHIVTPYA